MFKIFLPFLLLKPDNFSYYYRYPFRNLVSTILRRFSFSALKAKEVEDIYPEQVIKVDSSKHLWEQKLYLK